MNRHLVSLLVIGVVALAWGVGHGAREAAAAGAGVLAVVLASAAWTLISARGASIKRRHPRRAFEDDSLPVVFTLENRSSLPFFCPVIEDAFLPDKAHRKRAVVYPLVPARRAALTRYRGECLARRGRYPLGPARLTVKDPLGLFERTTAIGEREELLLYPRIAELPGLPTEEPAALFDTGPIVSRLTGASVDFLGVREYRPGDGLRHIHWAATARLGVPVIKQFEPRSSSFVTVFMDLHRLSMRGLGRMSTLEYSVRVAGSVTAWICRRGGCVRVVGEGQESFCVGPGSGEGHLLETLEQLAMVKADGELPLDEVLRRWAPEIEAPSTAVLIFSAMSMRFESYVDVVALLRARRIEMTAVLIDEESFTAIWAEQHRRPEEQIGMDDLARALLAEGASVVIVRSGDDLEEAFANPLRPGDEPPGPDPDADVDAAVEWL